MQFYWIKQSNIYRLLGIELQVNYTIIRLYYFKFYMNFIVIKQILTFFLNNLIINFSINYNLFAYRQFYFTELIIY